MKRDSQRVVALLTLAGFLALTSAIKVAFHAQDELERGRAALAMGQQVQAVEHFERAVRWYLPGLGAGHEAAAALWALVEWYEQDGQRQQALDTCRLLRASFYATRNLFTPGQEWIGRCNQKIADLMARQPPSTEAGRGQTFKQRRQHYLTLLERERPPYTGAALAAEAGFFGWVGCLVGLIVQGFTRRGEVKTRPLLTWAAAFAFFYILWLSGLTQV